MMLVIERGAGESFSIGERVTVTVLSLRTWKDCQPVVRIGIDAPREVQVVRDDAKARDRKADHV